MDEKPDSEFEIRARFDEALPNEEFKKRRGSGMGGKCSTMIIIPSFDAANLWITTWEHIL